MNQTLKMNKKGAMDQVFATIFFIVVFALIVSVFLYANNLNNPIEQEITSLHIKLDDEENFANLMNSYSDNANSKTMTDLLSESIVLNQFSKFDSIMEEKLIRDYSEKYWRWVIYTSDLGEKFELGISEIIYEHERQDYSKFPSESWSGAMQIPILKNNKQHYIAF